MGDPAYDPGLVRVGVTGALISSLDEIIVMTLCVCVYMCVCAFVCPQRYKQHNFAVY